MPTLDWLGKAQVRGHHLEVPYRALAHRYSFGEAASGNAIIHGDNLLALKALLPRYAGRVRCIYIDPPYNTGNESWVYNDNVNDPIIKKWLGKVVGREGEDLSRHDKWLSMMYPRLKLLRELLAPDGAIFISIDDNEQANLRLVCDEIFGESNFIAKITWENNFSFRNDAKGIPNTTDNLLAYAKNPGWQPRKLRRTAEMDSRYTAPDRDPVPWTSTPAHAPSANSHKGMVYGIQHPYTGEIFYPPAGRCWALEQAKVFALMGEWAAYRLELLDDAEKRAAICNEPDVTKMPEVKAVVLAEPLANARKKMLARYAQGSWPAYYFTKGGQGGLRVKKYLDASQGKVVGTLWKHEEVGTTTEAKNEIKAFFGGTVPFDTPKPTRLIERILSIATDKDSLVLDSFAGSGTTAHAVLNLNQKDGGRRHFLLIELMDYAEAITAERVRRVIQGYGTGARAVPGTGGGFSFYELGAPLFEGEKINPDFPPALLREYVYFMETQEPLTGSGTGYLLNLCHGTAYYFCYEPDRQTTLSGDFLAHLDQRADRYVIYADSCILSEEELARHKITFKKIPRNLARL